MLWDNNIEIIWYTILTLSLIKSIIPLWIYIWTLCLTLSTLNICLVPGVIRQLYMVKHHSGFEIMSSCGTIKLSEQSLVLPRAMNSETIKGSGRNNTYHKKINTFVSI